jgi:prepilin-type N-terminal cleavage/methylation domain-containing protein
MPPMRDERGFTLLEVLAALLIVTFVITTSLWVFLERNKRIQQASEITLAYQALANEAEYWRREDYSQLEKQPPTFKSTTEILAPLAPYETVVGVQEIKPGIKRVTLTIRWAESKREAKLNVLRVNTGGGPLW